MHIQLALDRLTIRQAIEMAVTVSEYVDWLEVGTSLIKEYGMDSVSAMRGAFPDRIIVADMKTFDNAVYELNMCYGAGADIATVMGAAPLVTVDACMNTAAKAGKRIMIDLLNTSEEQVRGLSAYTDAIFCLHVSKDEQELQGSGLVSGGYRVPSCLREGERRKLAFAGGIHAGSLDELKRVRPHVAIVGSAITKAKDPVAAAQAFQYLAKGVTR